MPTVVVVPYDPGWPEAFRTHERELERALAPWLTGGVHHIGSTAVPGLAAKPMLDMMAGVRELAAARDAVPVLEQLGWEPGTHRPHEALWFGYPAGAQWHQRTAHLHLTKVGSRLWRERLAFRDALRADEALLREYERLKRDLAAQATDVGPYTAAKRAFVAAVLAEAGIRLDP